jgi:rhodanese-related sulfurtransferase
MDTARARSVKLDRASRCRTSSRRDRVAGAVHLPTDEIPDRAPLLLDPATPVITYCWGPGCDGASGRRSRWLGYRVKEMIGGIEYWIREGFPVETDTGTVRRPPNPLTAPEGSVRCEC